MHPVATPLPPISEKLCAVIAAEERLIHAALSPETLYDFEPRHRSVWPGPRAILTAEELLLCKVEADRRHAASRAAGLVDQRIAASGDIELLGVQGEAAFAKFLTGQVEFAAIGSYKRPDVAGYQVRATHYTRGRLILGSRDCARDVFILVRGGAVLPQGCGRYSGGATFEIYGWTLGALAQQEKYRHGPSYWSPAADLFDMEWLPSRKDLAEIKAMPPAEFKNLVESLMILDPVDECSDLYAEGETDSLAGAE
jgi:hypothetical protein